jgi:hypothetical protein
VLAQDGADRRLNHAQLAFERRGQRFALQHVLDLVRLGQLGLVCASLRLLPVGRNGLRRDGFRVGSSACGMRDRC